MQQDEEDIAVRAFNPDVLVPLVFPVHALTLKDVVILFDTGTGNKQRLITELAEGYTQNHCTALMCLHAYTRCDFVFLLIEERSNN